MPAIKYKIELSDAEKIKYKKGNEEKQSGIRKNRKYRVFTPKTGSWFSESLE